MYSNTETRETLMQYKPMPRNLFFRMRCRRFNNTPEHRIPLLHMSGQGLYAWTPTVTVVMCPFHLTVLPYYYYYFPLCQSAVSCHPSVGHVTTTEGFINIGGIRESTCVTCRYYIYIHLSHTPTGLGVSRTDCTVYQLQNFYQELTLTAFH